MAYLRYTLQAAVKGQNVRPFEQTLTLYDDPKKNHRNLASARARLKQRIANQSLETPQSHLSVGHDDVLARAERGGSVIIIDALTVITKKGKPAEAYIKLIPSVVRR